MGAPEGPTELEDNTKLILNFTAISLFMVLSTVASFKSPIAVSEVPKIDQVNPVKTITQKEVERYSSTEEYVRKYFSDIPVMIAIARCESHFRQLDPDGSIHRGVVNQADVGVMQINEYYHGETAEKWNYDLYTIEGNTAYARNLYEREGTTPWNSSKACWGSQESLNLAVKS